MKRLKYLAIAALAIAAVAAPAVAQTPKPATPAAASEDAAKAAPKSWAGEFVAADQTARTVTLKHRVDKKPMQVTFGADEATFAILAQLKPGDPVKVTYVEMGDKRIIRSIVKG